MKKKLLIVSGCSWSNLNFKSDQHPELDTSWPKWHELLADMLDMELLSLGRNGAGQEYIFNSIVECVTNLNDEDRNRIGLIIPAWSRSPRRDYQISEYRDPKDPDLVGEWRNDRFDYRGDVYYMVRRSLRYFYQFQIFCERFNLPYKQVHMLDALRIKKNDDLPDQYEHGEVSQTLIDMNANVHPLYNKLNEEKFLGWPLIKGLGGYALDQKVICVSKEKFRISDIDFHPNKLGHEALAIFIHENL